MRDKTQDDRYFILTLFAIARELERKGQYSPTERIQLAVGLPPEHYGSLKEKFAAYFKRGGPVKFTYKDRSYTIFIDQVMVFPQAFAAVVPRSSVVVKTLRLFIIDIGGYTTDVLLLQNGKPDLQFCRSLETGVITMNNEVIRKVSTKFDMKIEDEHISTVLQNRETYLPDEVKEEIFKAARLHANDILHQLRELQVDLRQHPAAALSERIGPGGQGGVYRLPQRQRPGLRDAGGKPTGPVEGVAYAEKRKIPLHPAIPR